jgi:predicted NBD/HSP70 family sugar kinase
MLIGGTDQLAGELGHAPVDASFIDAINADRPEGLAALSPQPCSCGLPTDSVQHHLEAFASTRALVQRVTPDEPEYDVISRIIDQPEVEPHRRALRDVGALVGHSLVGPVAMLNPATITLVGPLAAPAVLNAVEISLSDAHPFGTFPEIRSLGPGGSLFADVQGAGLAVLRERVFRRLDHLLGGRRDHAVRVVGELTHPLEQDVWTTDGKATALARSQSSAPSGR